jgi:endonuclease-3
VAEVSGGEDAGRDTRRAVRAPLILERLAEAIPDARIALDFTSTWELLAATILSAQSTDERVNRVTPALFARFPDPAATAGASQEEVEALIGELGLFRNKARNLRAAAAMIVEQHGGEVPADMTALIALPGVARKTANVVLANAFGIHEGIAVDTHVGRLARRLALSRATDPVAVERDLMQLYPRERWLAVSDLLIHHGRGACDARARRCDACPIEDLCPSSWVAGREDRR